MMMFARYGTASSRRRTLDNFYSHQHPGGFICREIRADGSDCFQNATTSTGPNLLPWTELMYTAGSGHRPPAAFPGPVRLCQVVEAEQDVANEDLLVERLSTGMNNTPRVPEGYNQIFSSDHMEWLDIDAAGDARRRVRWQIGYIERWQEIEVRGQLAAQKRHQQHVNGAGFLRPLRERVAGATKAFTPIGRCSVDVLGKASGPFRGSRATRRSSTVRRDAVSADHHKCNAL